jgi:hypothetical protein
MRRRKRLTIIRTGLALAALAIPATAQAKPVSTDESKVQYRLGPAEIPYLSHGQGVDASQFGGGVSPDDRSVSRAAVARQSLEIPYLSHGQGVTPAELGITGSKSPDDRPVTRATIVDEPVVSDGGSSFDVNPFAVSGLGLGLLLLAGAMGLGIRQSRKSKLSPA